MPDKSKVAEALKKIKTKKKEEAPISEAPTSSESEGSQEDNAEIVAGLQNSGIYRKYALQRLEFISEIGKAQFGTLKLIDEKLGKLIEIFESESE